VTRNDDAALEQEGGVTGHNSISYADDRRNLGVYGGLQAARCPSCGHVSPSDDFLTVHLIRRCCGTLRQGRVSWNPINLGLLSARPPVKPGTLGLVYPGRLHVLSGPPESCKTLIALVITLEEIRAGGQVLLVDLETGPYETRDRLTSLGATNDDLCSLLYVEPEAPPDFGDLDEIINYLRPTLVVLDASAGCYALLGLDDNKRVDVEHFVAALVTPFRQHDIAVIAIDHVTKNADTRGRFSIGSERKIGSCDVHLSCDAVVPFGRGRNGLVKITTMKDRFGWLPRPGACEIELRSDSDTGAIAWTIGASAADDGDGWRPTELMQRVSDFLELQSEPVSLNTIETTVKGRRDWIRRAVEFLKADGFATETNGPNKARLFTLISPFTPVRPGSPQFAPEDPGVGSPQLAPYVVGGRAHRRSPTTRANPTRRANPNTSAWSRK
jgi:AAA domain